MPQAAIEGLGRKWEVKVEGRDGGILPKATLRCECSENGPQHSKIFHKKYNNKMGIIINSCFKNVMLRINDFYMWLNRNSFTLKLF